jgi:hypothetical protein
MELRPGRFPPEPVSQDPDYGESLRWGANGLNADAANICESPNPQHRLRGRVSISAILPDSCQTARLRIRF